MSDQITIKVSGVNDIVRQIGQDNENLNIYIDAEIRDGAQAIAAEAKQRAPSDQGILRNLIVPDRINDGDNITYEVVSGADYSAYLEFGTREHVQVPPGLEEFAADFMGDFTSGEIGASVSLLTAKEAIFAWCQRKGIDEKLWYAIYVQIMVHGIEPRPFFYSSAARQQPIIMSNIEKAIERAIGT